MYNRYTPQGDGSHRRRTMPDSCPPPPKPRPPEPPCRPEPCPPPLQPRREKWRPQKEENCFGFLKNLIPKDFDTGDLMILLLLLLMAGDCQEDQNFAILTLVLYLFL